MKILTTLKKKEGAMHWYGQRLTALMIAPLVLFFVFQGSMLIASSHSILELFIQLKNTYPVLILTTIFFVAWHGVTGIESILDDYVHNEKTKFVAYSLTKLMGLLIVKSFYVLLCI